MDGRMAKTIHFLLGLHCHQPVGNFDSVFESAAQLAYRPFLETLQRHPKLDVTLHYSGILLEWLQIRHPEILAMIKGLVDKGRVEMMTGGFYEPILPVIPERDQLGQIAKLSHWLKEHFATHAAGLWLAARVWEPTLPKTLAQAGVEFLCVDDAHFKSARFEVSELTGLYVIEHQGK